jgi:hypothetical protein
MTIYLQHENMLASTDTTCADDECTRGCKFPQCSKDFQKFSNAKAANRHAEQLRLSGFEVRMEDWED